jgi:hypothetical protein
MDGLQSRKHKGFQNVSYGLTDEIISVRGLSEEEREVQRNSFFKI